MAEPITDVEQKTREVAGGIETPTVPKVDAVTIDADDPQTQLSVDQDRLLTQLPDLDMQQVGSEDVVQTPQKPESSVGQIAEVERTADKIQDASAAQGTVSYFIDPIQGVLSEEAIAKTATQPLDPKATVQYQMSQLMESIKEGTPPPAWASGAVRKVTAIMNQRGMGASTMAASAMVQAVMEAGIPIAAADAQAYGKIQLQNLSNEQATALQNAATVAGMDTANLNARLTSAVNNAKNFLSMDIANLTNEQTSNTLTYQSKLKGILTDAAEENARKQFNAKNELQVEEFFTELGVQIETANANRNAAMDQFNISEKHALAQYNRTMQDAREKFNVNMQFAVDQSNVLWRRETNTADTALQNETNRINTQNSYNASQQAMNQLWQMYRDNATFNYQKTENALNRQEAIGLMALQYSYNQQLLDRQQKDNLQKLVGAFISGWGGSS